MQQMENQRAAHASQLASWETLELELTSQLGKCLAIYIIFTVFFITAALEATYYEDWVKATDYIVIC